MGEKAHPGFRPDLALWQELHAGLVPLSVIVKATGLSPSASQIRSGKQSAHRRHRPVLIDLAKVELPADVF